MINVYLVDINETILTNSFQKSLRVVSNEHKLKAQKFRFKDDFKRFIYGKLLIAYIASSFSDDKLIFPLHIKENEFGKPYFGFEFPYYFNISHSGAWIAMGWSSREIGVDIEENSFQNFDLDIAENFFSNEEYSHLINEKDKIIQMEQFFKYWTLKESYLKYIGTGFSTDIKEISFSLDHSANKFYLNGSQKGGLFFSNKKIDNYILSVCSDLNERINLQYVSINDICKRLAID